MLLLPCNSEKLESFRVGDVFIDTKGFLTRKGFPREERAVVMPPSVFLVTNPDVLVGVPYIVDIGESGRTENITQQSLELLRAAP